MALDQGTSSSRALVFDSEGRIRSLSQRETSQYFPHPGWVEQDALEIWSNQAAVASESLNKAGIHGSQIAAVGITNQRETPVIWDRKTGEPVGNAIGWQDRRTADSCEKFRQSGVEDFVRKTTGLLLDPYFSATKIAWILEHVKGTRERAEAGDLAFGTIDSWLAFKLTGGNLHVTDMTNASRTLLYDIRARQWSIELLEIFNIPGSLLPEVCASSAIYGEITTVKELAGVLLASIAGDQQSSLMGQLCTEHSAVKTTYGTGCFTLMHTGIKPTSSEHGLLTTMACANDENPRYALEGSVFTCGGVIQWLRDGIGLIRSAEEIEPLAASVPDSGGVVLVPAFTGLGAPRWDPYARGTIIGITQGTNSGLLARAALESIVFQVADLLEALEADTGQSPKELRVDGAAAKNNLLMQLQADISNLPVIRPEITESTALGAAYLAGLAVGYWRAIDHLEENWHVERRFEPSLPAHRVSTLRTSWIRAVERSGNWADNDP